MVTAHVMPAADGIAGTAASASAAAAAADDHGDEEEEQEKKLITSKNMPGSNKLETDNKLSEINPQTSNGVKCRNEWPVTKTEALTPTSQCSEEIITLHVYRNCYWCQKTLK